MGPPSRSARLSRRPRRQRVSHSRGEKRGAFPCFGLAEKVGNVPGIRLQAKDALRAFTRNRAFPCFTSSMDIGYSSVGYFRPSSSSHRLPITDHRLPFFTSSMDIGYWIFIGWIFSPPFSAIPIVILFYLKPKTINPYSHILPSKAFDSFSASPTSSYIPSLAVFSRTRPGPTRV